MKILRLTALLGFFLILPCFARAADLLPFSTRIKLVVSGNDSVKGPATSYFSQAIRKLDGAKLVDTGEEMTIAVVTMQLRNNAGTATGHAYSVLVTKHVWGDFMRDTFARSVNEPTMKFLNDYLASAETVESLSLSIGGTDDVEEVCKTIIARIDGEIIEPQRASYAKTVEGIKAKEAKEAEEAKK